MENYLHHTNAHRTKCAVGAVRQSLSEHDYKAPIQLGRKRTGNRTSWCAPALTAHSCADEITGGLRELVIGDKNKHRGYFALYDVYEDPDEVADDEENEPKGVVVVNAIRSQHESGYH